MLVAKEATLEPLLLLRQRELYKMFVAFDKEMLQGKSVPKSSAS